MEPFQNELVGNQLFLGTTPSHISSPPNKNGALKSYNLASDAAWCRAGSVGTRSFVRVSMWPPRRGECSGARDILTDLGAFAYAGIKQDELAVDVVVVVVVVEA